jgi:hypothetical protein
VTANTGELQQESPLLKTGFESQDEEAGIANRTASERIRKFNLVHNPSLREVEISFVRNRNRIEDCKPVHSYIEAFPENSPKGERNLSATIQV